MRMATRRTRFSRRRSRRKTFFPIVAIVPKRFKPRYASKISLNTNQAQKSSISLVKTKTAPKSRGTVDYKNVILLRKLITAEGKILPRRINKLNSKQQRCASKSIKSARIMGLLPFINKSRSLNI